jgi:uncharacterized protein (TIGR02145 family)
MMKHTIALFFAFACLKVHGQVVDSTTVISNAPCVNISANAAQNDVVVRLVLPPLEALNAETATIQLTNSTGNILPYFKGQAWADSSEVWVRFDSLPVEESIFFVSTLGYSHPNDPHQVFDLYDSFDASSLDEDIWTASVQSGASFNVGNGELSMNVTQTDNYCSIYSNQSFDLDQNWAIHLQARTQDNRGHVCMAIGSGYDAARLAQGGYNQLNGYGISESHDADWTAHLKVDGNGFQPEYVGEDLSYAPMIASWADNEYRLFISGSLASTLEVGVEEKPNGEHPFFIWLNAWDGNNRSLWLDFVALYVAAEAIIQVDESGCLEPQACNYNPAACTSDESCDYTCCPGPGCCHAGTTWDMDLQRCVVANPADTNLDGCVQLNDLLDVLSAYGDCGADESPWVCGDPLEYQGYEYATVQIGDQCWFAENLRAENYRNGDVIPVVMDDATWNESTMGTKRAFENDLSNVSTMGYLYSWFAGNDDRELCPTGWHVPSKTELAQIEMALGMSESDALSEGWHGSELNVSERMRSSSWGGTDELGFNAIRAPWHSGDPNATQFLTSTLWDSNNGLNSTTHCWTVVVTSYQQSNYHADSALPGIYSARCLQDSE